MQDCNHLGAFDASTMAVGYVKTEVEGKSELQFPHEDCPAVINDLLDFEDLIMIDGFLMRALWQDPQESFIPLRTIAFMICTVSLNIFNRT